MSLAVFFHLIILAVNYVISNNLYNLNYMLITKHVFFTTFLSPLDGAEWLLKRSYSCINTVAAEAFHVY